MKGIRVETYVSQETLPIRDAVIQVLGHLGIEILYDPRRLNAALLDYVDEHDPEARLLTQNNSDELMAPFVNVLVNGQLHQRASWYAAAQHATFYLQHDRVLDKNISRDAMDHFVSGILYYLDASGVEFTDKNWVRHDTIYDFEYHKNVESQYGVQDASYTILESGSNSKSVIRRKHFMRRHVRTAVIVFLMFIALIIFAIYMNSNPVEATSFELGHNSDTFPTATLTLENNADTPQHVLAFFTFHYTTKDGVAETWETSDRATIPAHSTVDIESRATDWQYDHGVYSVDYEFHLQ